MAKAFKLKYVIIAFVLIAIISSCTAFSVSYSRWTNAGAEDLSANLTLGSWNANSSFANWSANDINGSKDNGYSQAVVDELKKDEDYVTIGEPNGNLLYGGIIFINRDEVETHAWYQGGRKNDKNKPYGYTTEIYIEEGTKFIICSFSRIVDPNNAERSSNDDGYAVINCDDGLLDYTTDNKDGSDNNRVIFTAQKTGYYTIDVHEGTKKNLFDNTDKHDIVTITFSEEKEN